MAIIDNIEVELAVHIGAAKMPLSRLLSLGRGAVIPLDDDPVQKGPGIDNDHPVRLLVNGHEIGTAKVVLQGEDIAVQVIDPKTA